MQRAEAKGEAVPQRYDDLVQPHIDSFDYFLGEGMQHVVEGLEGIEVGAGAAQAAAGGAALTLALLLGGDRRQCCTASGVVHCST